MLSPCALCGVWAVPRASQIKCSSSEHGKTKQNRKLPANANEGDMDWIPVSGRAPGEGNGNPLQYSCLENPMDGGAWRVTVYRVAKRQILYRLSHQGSFFLLCIRLSFLLSFVNLFVVILTFLNLFILTFLNSHITSHLFNNFRVFYASKD